MNRAVSVGFAIALFASPNPLPAANFSSRIERVEFLGRDYVRLADWARVNNFESRGATGGKILQLTNHYHKLTFEVDSREAGIDGVKVALSFPVAARFGIGYIAAIDLQSTVQPLLYPRKTSGSKIKTICLDAGHGGRDTGNIHGGAQEKKYTLLLAQELRGQLTRAGFNVVLTRTADSSVELPARAAIANQRGADLLVSLHLNATPSSRNTVKGIETYCFTPAGASSSNAGGRGAEARPSRGNRNDEKNVLLAYQLQRALAKNLSAEDRGVKRARFQVLRDAEMPAVLIEAGFLSHPTEGRKLIDPAYRRQMAKAIVGGIETYRKIIEPTAPRTPDPKPQTPK